MTSRPSSSRLTRISTISLSTPSILSTSLLLISIVPAVLVVDAHESCCEAAARARAARRLDTVVLSKSAEACPWLLLGLLTTALLAAAKLPIGSIRSLLTTSNDADISSETSSGKGGGAGRRLFESVRITAFAAFLGLITPLCSCGALPLAAGLLAAGADLRAVVAFLTAAQSAGLDSAAVTVGMLGWKVAAFRLVGSVVLAVASGVAVGMGGRGRTKDDAAKGKTPTTTSSPSCAGTSDCDGEEKKSDDPCCPSDGVAPENSTSEKDNADTPPTREEESSFWLWTFLRSLLRTFDEIWPVLLFGIIVTSCVQKVWNGQSLPLQPPQPPRPPPPGWDEEDDGPWDDGSSSEDASLLASLGLPPWAVDLLVRTSVVAAALPLQLCEHGVVSFAAALEKAGATPGTAHAFLLSAPATNAALRGAAGIAIAAVALSYVADRPDVLGGDGGSKIGDAVETFSLPGWFADFSVYVCGALFVASLATRAQSFLSSRCNSTGGKEMTVGKVVHEKTD